MTNRVIGLSIGLVTGTVLWTGVAMLDQRSETMAIAIGVGCAFIVGNRTISWLRGRQRLRNNA